MHSLLESVPNYIHYGTTMKPYQEVHEITSITYDTTMRSHQEVHGITSFTYNTTLKSHQEFHRITSNSYYNHVSPTNHRFIKHNNLMPISNQPTINSCFPFHTQHNKNSFSFNLIQHTWHHTSCVYGKTLYQAGKQPHQRTNQN